MIAARREEKLRETATRAPARISWVRMDLTDREDRVRAIETVAARHGRLDVLINNAGNQIVKPFAEQSEEEIAEVFVTNLISAAQLISRALPLLRESRGNVVNVSSTAGRYTQDPSSGITMTSGQVRTDFDVGRLITVLGKFTPDLPGYHLYYPNRRRASAAFSPFVDAVRYRSGQAAVADQLPFSGCGQLSLIDAHSVAGPLTNS